MTEEVEAQYRNAIKLLLTTLADVAEGCGRSYRTIQSYWLGERRVTDGAASDLVAFLRRRATQLEGAAKRQDGARQVEEPDGNG
jgi:hypothetical protein